MGKKKKSKKKQAKLANKIYKQVREDYAESLERAWAGDRLNYSYWEDDESIPEMTPRALMRRPKSRDNYVHAQGLGYVPSRSISNLGVAHGRAPVDVEDRYYYYDDGESLPPMHPNDPMRSPYIQKSRPERRPHPQAPMALVPAYQQGNRYQDEVYQTRVAVPARYDAYTAYYQSEYDAVSDAYGAYLNNRDESMHRPGQYDREYYPNYYASDYEANIYDTYYGAPVEPPRGHVQPPIMRQYDPRGVRTVEHGYYPERSFEQGSRSRGPSFHISEEIIEKIVAQAAYDIKGVIALFSGMPADLNKRYRNQKSTAQLHNGHLTIDLQIILAYGINGADAFGEVSEHVANRVKEMTGLVVDDVRVNVVDVISHDDFYALCAAHGRTADVEIV